MANQELRLADAAYRLKSVPYVEESPCRLNSRRASRDHADTNLMNLITVLSYLVNGCE